MVSNAVIALDNIVGGCQYLTNSSVQVGVGWLHSQLQWGTSARDKK